MTDETSRTIRERTLAEVATSPRILIAIGVLLVVAFAFVVVFALRGDDDQGTRRGGGGRECDRSTAINCDDLRRPAPSGG